MPLHKESGRLRGQRQILLQPLQIQHIVGRENFKQHPHGLTDFSSLRLMNWRIGELPFKA